MKKTLLLFFVLLLTGCSLMDYDLVSPLDDQTSDGLPVFYIHPKPISKDFYSPVTVIYKGKTYNAEGKIRGGMTAYYPKKSYTLKFQDDDLFNDSTTGFENRKKLVLICNFDENSHIRNRLAYWIWNQMNNSCKIYSYSSVVYTNGAYEGLYTTVDFINENYIERSGFSSGGNLFKGTTNEADFYIKSELNSGFEKKTGLPIAGEEGAYTDLEDFITFINQSTDVDFINELSNWADIKSYYDWWFFTSFLSARDSMGKNSYHYHDLQPGGNWHYIPWDFNESFGQDFITKRKSNSFDPENYSKNGIFNRVVPNFSSTYNPIYRSLLEGNLLIGNIINKIDSLHSEIDAAADRDFAKWGGTYRNFRKWDDRKDFTSVDEEINYIKTWITAQYNLVYDYYDAF